MLLRSASTLHMTHLESESSGGNAMVSNHLGGGMLQLPMSLCSVVVMMGFITCQIH